MNIEKLDKLEKKIAQVVSVISELKEEKNELSARNNQLEAEVQKLVEENKSLKDQQSGGGKEAAELKAKLEKLERIPFPTVTPPTSSPYVVLDSRVNASYPVVISLLRENVNVYRSQEVLKTEKFKAAAGSFLIKNTPQVQKSLPALLEKCEKYFEKNKDAPNILWVVGTEPCARSY